MICSSYQWNGEWAGIDNDKIVSKPFCKCGFTYQEHKIGMYSGERQ